MKPWKILSSKQVMKDQWLGVRSDTCEREDGHIIEGYHVLEYPDWVSVVALTDEGNIVLVKEYRHGAQIILHGLPSGTVDEGETDMAAVSARELREETGYEAREMIHVGSGYANPAAQNNFNHYYLALGAVKTSEQALDANEEIDVVVMPYAEFLAYENQAEQHALHAAALFYAERYFAKYPSKRPKG